MAPQPLRHGVQFCAIVVVEPSTCQAPQSAICNCPFPAPPVRQRALADLAFLDLQPWGAASGKYAVLGTQCPVASYDAVGTLYCVLCTAYSLLPARSPRMPAAKNCQRTSAASRFLAPRRGGRPESANPCCLTVYGGRPPRKGKIARDSQTNAKKPKP